MRRRRLAASVLAVTAACGIGAGTAQATTGYPTAPAAPQKYVAIGDSYSAASGNVPPDPTASPN